MTRSLTVDLALLSPSASSTSRRRRPRTNPETLLFAGLLLVYVAVAAWLVFLQHSIMEDALSRVANAQYVLFSREPKLANLGFVWTPLPSLLVLPFLPLKTLWPPLVEQGFLANILSAVAMAAAARVLVGLLDDLRVPRRVAFTLGVAFGLQPMIVWFGANGMTEALLILFLLLTSRSLVRWLDDDDFRHLMAAGGYLALGYLARYEVLACGCAAVALVAFVTWRRLSTEQINRRNAATVADTLLVGAPLLAAFLFWAIASWVIVGHPFDQFSSAYGNSALVESGGGRAAINPTLIVMQWLVLAPVLPLVVAAAGVIAVRRRDLALVPPVALLSSVLAFEALVYFAGSLFGFLRYQIVVVPLLAVLAGYIFSRRRQRRRGARPALPGTGCAHPAARPARHSRPHHVHHARSPQPALRADPGSRGSTTAAGHRRVQRRVHEPACVCQPGVGTRAAGGARHARTARADHGKLPTAPSTSTGRSRPSSTPNGCRPAAWPSTRGQVSPSSPRAPTPASSSSHPIWTSRVRSSTRSATACGTCCSTAATHSTTRSPRRGPTSPPTSPRRSGHTAPWCSLPADNRARTSGHCGGSNRR